ncbi:MAG TPA: hypothetical protein VFI03_00925 [Solirubrobacterales bacterium]|nr:hypothetical protein [Solirubrobacterales bacterium]
MAPSVGSTGAAAASRGFVVALGALLAFALILLSSAAPAMAGKGTIAVFSASLPRGVAVNETTGNVYVMEDGKVGVYDADGNPLFAFGNGLGPEPGQFANTAGISVNQVSGDIYTFDMQFNYRIQQFDSSGTFIRMWGHDVNGTLPGTGFEICTAASGDTCQAGVDSPAPGGFSAEGLGAPGSHLAIDPVTGNVIAADGGNQRLQVFSSSGAIVSVLGSASLFPGSNSPAVVAADSQGNTYGAGYGGTIQKFSPAGELIGPIGTGIAASRMAIDTSDDHLFASGIAASGDWRIAEYDPSGTLLEEHAVGIPEPSGLAVNSATGRVYVSDGDGGKVIVIDEVGAPPLATVNPATEIAPTSVKLNGTVNPEGTSFDTKWRFVCTPACPGLTGGNAGNGTTDVPVSEVATGLDPNTTYQVRLIATREFGGGQTVSGVGSFTTAATEPVISLVAASRVTDTTARLGAAIDARHSATTYRFEFGTDSGYGVVVPAGGSEDAGAELGPRPAFQRITGLTPETTYHFRMVAENSAGEVESEDVTFTTVSNAEAALRPRGIELASPPDKGNQNPSGYLSDDGESVIWSTFTGTAGSPLGKLSLFKADRTADGWVSQSLLPRPEDLVSGGEQAYVLVANEEDFSKQIFQVGERGNSAEEPAEALTLVRYNRASGEQEILDFFPEGRLLADSDSEYLSSADTSHLYLWVREGIETSLPRQIYEIGSGTRQLVSVMPDSGEKPACGTVLEQRVSTLSDDGSRFYFMSRGDDCFSPQQIYLRDDHRTLSTADDTTTRVSTPAVAGPEGVARVIRTNPAGDSLIYYSEARVTAEDTDDSADLFRWTLGEGSTCLTCMVDDIGLALSGDEQLENTLVSEDMSHIYVSTGPGLVPGEGEGDSTSIYAIVDGELSYASPGRLGENGSAEEISTLTPSGEVLVFYSKLEKITADPTGGFEQYYRYSERTGNVECLSCAPPGRQPALPEGIPFPGASWGSAPPAAKASLLSDDGATFVFSTEAAILPRDVNGGPDVYEWHNGTIRLVTDGEGEYGDSSGALWLRGMSSDGTNVLFSVAAKLTGYERDDVSQLFVARLDGGFPRPKPEAGCAEDACQGPLDGAPAFARPGSVAIAGPGNASEANRRAKPRCRSQVKRAHSSRVKARCAKRNSKRKGKASGHSAKADRNRGGK